MHTVVYIFDINIFEATNLTISLSNISLYAHSVHTVIVPRVAVVVQILQLLLLCGCLSSWHRPLGLTAASIGCRSCRGRSTTGAPSVVGQSTGGS